MKILQNYDLKKLNTFGISAFTKYFVEVSSESDLKELFLSPIFKNNKRLFLGSGSNILITDNFDGIVVLNKLKGIKIIKEDSWNVYIRSMGGEIWHDLVMFSIDRGFWGIENLALIPGSVGAAPMQNIGAYGVELKDTLEGVETYEIERGEKKVFQTTECNFGYRDSVFKNKLKDKYFITSITLKLSKIPKPNISYTILSEFLEKNKVKVESPKDISDAVITIRKSKLPDPYKIGNAGSFFKNVFIDNKKLEELISKYPNIPYFREEENNPVRNRPREASATVTLGRPASNGVKIPAGWLIEQCGWKGKKEGNVGVHEHQALVLVNYGEATGKEVKNLAEKIITSVNVKFGLKLETEVNLI